MDNLRGGDDTGAATLGSLRFGNTFHTYSGDTFCKPPKPPACIDLPSIPALLNPRIQECVSLADTYCIVAGVTWDTAGRCLLRAAAGQRAAQRGESLPAVMEEGAVPAVPWLGR
jgi:hypothetical protein